MTSRHHLRAIAARADFRRLFATRLTSQFADGVFQAGLAGSVLFNPDRAADPVTVALGFAVLLMPYSLVAPFAGVMLDRWRRRNVLMAANAARAALIPLVALLIAAGTSSGLFLSLALVVIGVNRFFLAGLSAALPHVTDDDHLVTANSASTTLGAVAVTAGTASALLLQELVGASDHGYALIASSAVLGYLGSVWIAAGFAPAHLGPDGERPTVAVRHAAADVARGTLASARHLVARPTAGTTLLAITAQRLCLGVSMMAILLLYRNHFDDAGLLQSHEAGLAQVLVVGTVGGLLAAAFAPTAIRRLGRRAWVVALLLAAGVTMAVFGVTFTLPTLLPVVFVIGLVSQGVKIATDTALQTECDDDFRGRVFSVYDTMFNASFVLGMVIGALTLPLSGKSYAVLFGVAAGYALIAAGYWWAARPGTTETGEPATVGRPSTPADAT